MFFPLLLSRYKIIEIIIKIKANFYKEIAHFTILVAIIENKISKYFFLTGLSQILYISTRQAYTSGIQRGIICFLFPTHQAVK